MSISLAPRPLRRYLRHGMLPQLAAFEAVMRLGSVTRAAEALCIAQPTLSGHLRKLEAALEVRLFDCPGRHLIPTDAAYVLLRATGDISSALSRCEESLADLRAGSKAEPPVRRQGARPNLGAAAVL
jgi:DNA-binding transcriptional LysR family regulator